MEVTFVIEPINTVDGSTLVISAQYEEVLRVFYFICQQQTNCFQRLLSSVNIVARNITFVKKRKLLP